MVSVIIGIILNFNDNKIYVTFSSQNNKNYKTIRIEKGTKVDLSLYNEDLDGFEFIGWYSSPTLERKIDDEYVFTTNKTIYSGYSKIINLNQIETLNQNGFNSYTVVSNGTDSIDSHQIQKLLSVGAIRIDLKNCNIKNNILTSEMFNSSDIKEVVLHNDVYSIEENTFENCYNLETITLSDNLTIIKENAFKNCVNLKNINLKEGLLEIGSNTFYGCLTIEKINIPSSVTTLGQNFLLNNPCLEDIIVSDQNQNFIDKDGILYSNNYSSVIKCPERKNENIILNNNTTIISPYSFYNAKISSIAFGNHVENIGEKAFYNCSNLESISVPSNSEYVIEESAFENCNNLTSVVLEKGLKAIKKAVFKNDTALTEIDIVNSTNPTYRKLEELSDDVFYNCTNLKTFEIPASVTNIGENVFYNCIKLNTVVIGDNITNITNRMFYNCYNLSNITINGNVVILGDGAFYNCKNLTTLNNLNNVTNIGYACFYNCELLNLINTENVNEIKEYSFYNCSSLQELNLSNISELKAHTFVNCENLENLTFGALIENIENNAFENSNNIIISLTSNPNIINEDNIIMSADRKIIYYYNSILNNHNATIPQETEEIYNCAFSGKKYLSRIDVDANNNYFDSIDGVLTNKEKTVLISYPGGNANANYIVPNSINTIKTKTFITNKLKNIEIGNNVVEIENNAFASVENLETIKLPFIGNNNSSSGSKTISIVFTDLFLQNQECVDNGKYLPSKLKKIEITNDTVVASYAFYGAINIEEIVYSNNVSQIYDYAFYGCKNLKNITFKGRVSLVKAYAFGKSNNLEIIKFGYNASLVLEKDCLPESNNKRIKIYVLLDEHEEISITSKKLYKNKFFTISTSSRQWDWFFDGEVI